MSRIWIVPDVITDAYRTLRIKKDPGETYVNAVFSGLRVKLSDIVRDFPPEGRSNLTLIADTLVVDVPSFSARGAVVMARSIEVSSLQGKAMVVPPHAGGRSTWQFLLQQVTGGADLKLTTPQAAEAGQADFAVPVGEDPLQMVYYIVASDGSPATRVTGGAAHLEDLLSRPWALNSLKASFAAASWLMHSDQDSNRATAQSMLSWVVACIRALRQSGRLLPGAYQELYNQAAALLVTLNVAPGAYFVPILSPQFYKTQANELLDALQSYEDHLKTLNNQTDLQDVLEQVSSALQGVAQDEVTPLQVQLNNINENIATLGDQIRSLEHLFHLQHEDARVVYMIMESDARLKEIRAFVEACIDLTLAVVDIGTSVGTIISSISAVKKARETIHTATEALADVQDLLDDDIEKLNASIKKAEGERDGSIKKALETIGKVVKGLFKAYKEAQTAIDAVTGKTSSKLTRLAELLMEAQQQLLISFQAAVVLTAQPDPGEAREEDEEGEAELPTSLAAVHVDPRLAWDNYIAEVEAELKNLYEKLGVPKINNYLASLKILAQYGKAIAAKMVTYASQLAQARVVKAQIQAAQNTEARWEELARKAQDDQERLAALKGVVQTRIDALRRSIYVAWTHYRNAYFFLYFKAPPTSVNLNMDAAMLNDAFAQVSLWMAQLFGDVPEGQKVRLPNDDVAITFTFDIVQQTDPEAEPEGGTAPVTDTALLTPANADQTAMLSWSIPLGSSQLKGVLPSGGNVAVWIKEATFFLEGIQPNGARNVMAEVATSGAYENGYGPEQAYTFVNQGLVGDYAYHYDSEAVYNRWAIDTGVYATPTPFTQWTMTFEPDGGDPSAATRLRMNLVVAYRRTS